MLDIIQDTLIDSLKMLPFLLISYIIIEYIEHKKSSKINFILSSSGKYGSVIGAILGCLPQCGFSVTASSLYSGRVITLGTLIAVFIATSDEAIPVLIANPSSFANMLKIIIVKLVLAIVIGIVIDILLSHRHKNSIETSIGNAEEHIHKMCSHCDCEHGILKSALRHTISIFIYIMIVSFVLNVIIHIIGQDRLSTILLSGSIFQPLVAAVIGMIPNCAASVLLTELYVSGQLSFASIIAGLSTGAGIGMVVLFRENKNIKVFIAILGITYCIGAISGIIIEIISSIF